MKKLCDMTIEELSFLREHDIIEAEAVNDEIMIRKSKEYQEKYHYWKTSKGIFKVHVYENGKRKVIERKTELGMIEYLIAWEKGEAGKNATFKYCYDQWRTIHDKLVDANTVHKYKSDYKRFFGKSMMSWIR